MKTETLTLNGYEYQVTAIPAREGVRVAARLANALAGAVKELPEDGFELNIGLIVRFIEPILSNPQLGDTLDYLIGVFSNRTVVVNPSNGTSQPLSRSFDVHFSDSYDDLGIWLAFSLKVSMSSFFRGVRGLGVQAAADAKSRSKSPSSVEQTGKSGE